AVARAGPVVLGLSLSLALTIAAARIVPAAAVATLLLVAATALTVAVLAIIAVTTLAASVVVATSARILGALVRGFRGGCAAEEPHDALDHADGVGGCGSHHDRRRCRGWWCVGLARLALRCGLGGLDVGHCGGNRDVQVCLGQCVGRQLALAATVVA